MSFLFGGGAKAKPQYTGIQIQTSSSILPIPLIYGLSRGAPNLLDYLDFQSHKQKQGKGGGAKGATSFTYSATVMLALGAGTISDIFKAWLDNGDLADYASLGFTLFTGTIPQAPWGYLTTAHPSHADPYNGIAYLAKQNYDLGASASLPNHNFEVAGLLYHTGVGGTVVDADPARLVDDFLTDPDHGVLFPTALIDYDTVYSSTDATTTGDSAYQTYCRAMGFALSPWLASQNAAADTLANWCMFTNTAPVWTGYNLKLIPYGDEVITANGVTYLPPLTVRFVLGDDDYVQDGDADPVKAARSDPADAYNAQTLNIRDRANSYNQVPVPYVNDNAIYQYGWRPAGAIDGSDICDLTMAGIVVNLIGQRGLYQRKTYKFTLDPRYAVLEPMDRLQITDPILGTAISVRPIEIEEQDNDDLEFTAEELPLTVGTTTPASNGGTTPNPINSQSDPGDVNPPWIGEPPSTLTGGGAQVWAAVSGGTNWGGAQVWVSRDNVTYQAIGEPITTPARQGVSTTSLAAFGGSNPDTTHSVAVNLTESRGALDPASSVEAAAGDTLSVLSNADYSNAEYFSYRDATLTSTYHYTLGGELYRGLYGSTAALHGAGSLFARLDAAIFKETLPADYVGVPLWFKFQSFNLWGQAFQDLSAVTAYPYTPSGTGFGGGSGGVPVTPTGLTATGGIQSAAIRWSANAASDNVTAYKLWRAPGTGASFGSASVIWTGIATAYTDAGLAVSTGYTYFLQAVNVVGPSAPTAGEDATTTSTALGGGGASASVAIVGTIANGDFVNCFDNSGTLGVRPADATDPTKYANGFVKVGGSSGSTTVYFEGLNDAVTVTVRGEVWLSETTPGGYQATVPSAAGSIIQSLGLAIPGVGVAYQSSYRPELS